MKRFFLLLNILWLSVESKACLNEYNVNIKGETNEKYEGLPVFYRSFDREYSQFYVNLFDLSRKESFRYQDLSDVSYQLARLGEYKKSLELLIWLNHKFPGQYKIVANLGTLYELNGNVDSAYHYIQKGLELNPKSHFGSEWVHLAILRAKMQMRANPNWIFQNKVLHLNLQGNLEQYSKKYNSVMDTIHQISYQMKERIPFTKAPDLILANILCELGQILADHFSIENAYVAYRISQYYDPKNQMGASYSLNLLLPLFKKYNYEESVFEAHFPPADQYQVLGNATAPRPLKNVTKQQREIHQPASSTYTLRITAILIALLISLFVYFKRMHYF